MAEEIKTEEPKKKESKVEAILDKNRLLPQHQAALMLVKQILGNPDVDNFDWLDLGCGKGQIIVNLNPNIPKDLSCKINFHGYDVANQSSSIAENIASQMILKSYNFRNGSFSDFGRLYDVNTKYDFITLINTVHEIKPHHLSLILFDSFIRLNENGTLYIFDMERLPNLELGAITWLGVEIEKIFHSFFCAMGSSYEPRASVWYYRTCNSWSIEITKSYAKINETDLLRDKDNIVLQTSKTIDDIIETKHTDTTRVLESLTKKGSEIADEETDVKYALYDFWALSHAREKKG